MKFEDILFTKYAWCPKHELIAMGLLPLCTNFPENSNYVLDENDAKTNAEVKE